MSERNHRKFAVLGSGLVSNLCSVLLRDTITLTKRKTPVFLDNVFFHDRIENRMMLRMFDIQYRSQDVPVFYHDNSTGKNWDKATDEIRLQIAKEKMGDTSKEIVLSDMNPDDQKFTNLFFDEGRLKHILEKETDVVELFPTHIHEFDDYVRVFFDEYYVDFEYLINTIPQPFFNPLLYNPLKVDFKCKALTFVTSHAIEPNQMIYSYNDCFWKRMFIKNSTLCIEFDSLDWNENVFNELFPKITDYKITQIPYGRIETQKIPDTKRIINIGRFAQWNHSLTTEHIVNKIINLNV